MFVFRSWYLLVFPTLILLHLHVAPYTKVEESFNIQAIHDILQYGVPLSNVQLKLKTLYDHMTFPGSVPRTFIGALIVASLAQPIAILRGLAGLDLQILARAVLGLINAIAICTFAKAVRTRYGDRTALWYTALQSSQFHVIYYASRTLPNMFAFCLSTFALAATLTDPAGPLAVRRYKLSFYLLTLATVIFRSELALLIAAQSLALLIKAQGIDGQIALIKRTVLPPVVAAAVVGILTSVLVDTYFWQSPQYLWPEAAAFVFNIVPKDGQVGASAWGTSPWYWYFVAAIPRLVMSPCFLLLPYGVLFTSQRQSILDQLLPSLMYTAIYSILPHKETRFLFPIVPQLTLAMALTASYISIRRQLIAKFVTIALVLSTIVISIFSHAILLPLSAQSYPGANTLRILHQQHNISGSDKIHLNVYLTNLALQTGITRFLEQPLPPTSSKGQKGQIPEEVKPVILPGSPDGRYPALTHYPRPTGLPVQTKQRLWKYDKTSPEDAKDRNEDEVKYTKGGRSLKNTKAASTAAGEADILPVSIPFWNQFDYVIVENPEPFSAQIGHGGSNKDTENPTRNWNLLAAIPSLSPSRPRISRKSHDQGNHLLPSISVDDYTKPSAIDTTQDGIYILLQHMYPWQIAWLYSLTHDVLVHGVGLGGFSLTRGYWVEYSPLQNRLYVFARRDELGFVDSDDHDGVVSGGKGGEKSKKIAREQSAA